MQSKDSSSNNVNQISKVQIAKIKTGILQSIIIPQNNKIPVNYIVTCGKYEHKNKRKVYFV